VPTIPPHIELVIERAMAKKPEDRFPSMSAFEEALDALPAAHVSRESLQPAPLVAPTPSSKRLGSAADSDADIRAARPRLVLALLAAVALLVGAALVSLSGLELATGHIFSQFELRLLLLGVAGTALTPALLWFLHVRRRIWESSSRVLSLLVAVRAAALAGIVSYGLFVLGFHLIDDFLVRFLGRPDVTAVGATWQGWNLLLPSASLVIGVAVGWRRRLLSNAQPGFRRLLMLWMVSGVALTLTAGIVRVGLAWRGLTLGH
jgi:serine/threonine-protein kinase